MPQENPHQEPTRPHRDHWVVRMNRRNRSGSFVLLFLAVGSHLLDHRASVMAWAFLVFNFLIYPQLAYWRARRSVDPMQTELDNLVIDSAFFGVWLASLHFPIWIAFTMAISTTINLTVFRGRQGTGQALLGLGLGILLTAPFSGLSFQADTNAVTTSLCLLGLTLYLLTVAEGAYGRAIKLHEAQEKLRESERALATANGALQQQLHEIRLLQDQLRQQANHDALTGLYNRHYLNATMAREVERCRRDGQPVSVLLIDIDHFKQINDSHGHQAGDEALRHLATLLRAHARVADIVCRYGGEEFLLVLPGMPKDVAIDRAEAYRRAFSQASIEHGDVRMHATLSIGVSSTSDHLTTPEALIAHADAALYQAKALGRDRVVSSSAAVAAEV